MKNDQTTDKMKETLPFSTPQQFLDHWQGHRRLTRRVIEAFPEKELHEFSVGGMRPFAALVAELLAIAVPGLREIVSGKVESFSEDRDIRLSKAEWLERWDTATEGINAWFAQIAPERFQEQMTIFGMYPGTVSSHLLYFIDNEIHHRGQGYVYLRALGIEPPAFWER